LGYNSYNTATAGDQLVIIGDNIATDLTGNVNNGCMTTSVLIGSGILRTTVGDALSGGPTYDNVLIGNNIWGSGGATTSQLYASVIIGSDAFKNGDAIVGTHVVATNVIIGSQAFNYAAIATGCTYIGANAGSATVNTAAGSNVGIGDGNSGVAIVAPTNNVSIGAGAVHGTDRNTILGYSISSNGGNFGSRNIIIGAQAAQGITTAISDTFILGTYDAVTIRTMFYGLLSAGNLLIGNSTVAAGNQEFGGAGSTNVVKLINGTKGGSNPIGGGYFYVVAGALHWVGSSGTDTVIATA
jgi:hypothetical protein